MGIRSIVDFVSKVLAHDWGMNGGKVKIAVRRAQPYYVPRRLGLGTDPSARSLQDQNIILLDAAEIIG